MAEWVVYLRNMAEMKNMVGQQFGKLIVVRATSRKDKYGYVYWLCSCACGNIAEVCGNRLRKGGTRSCGCLQTQNMSRGKRVLFKKHIPPRKEPVLSELDKKYQAMLKRLRNKSVCHRQAETGK